MGRIVGAVYLAFFVTAIVAEALSNARFQLAGLVFNVISYGFYLALTLLFYRLFAPVNRALSFVAALFGIAGCVVGVLGIFHRSPPNLNPLFFFGGYCFLIGYLIVWCSFLPRLLGVLMMLAGLGWEIFLAPAAARWSSAIEALGILAEGLLMLWLLIFGVNVSRLSDPRR
ncbi:MAG: hypothetical protein JO060_04030 [Candidatus Eremiobacteraeota bacterium]|nr:hypothetical protein [Candidatus Eremiobacteraeota bacterium]MBV9646147.1 hypothetical protein [Candidatus Eremiobacteraeota bacterium]